MLFGNFQIINIYVAKCLQKSRSEITESKLNDAQCSFRSVHITIDQIFTLQHIFVKSWDCGKDVYTCFVDLLQKAGDWVPRGMLWGPKEIHTIGQVTAFLLRSFVFVSGELITTVHCWTPTRMCAVTTPFHSIRALNRQLQPSRRGCHSWELQDKTFNFCRRFGTVSIFSTKPST